MSVRAVLQKVILVLLSCLLHSVFLMHEANAVISVPDLETSKVIFCKKPEILMNIQAHKHTNINLSYKLIS